MGGSTRAAGRRRPCPVAFHRRKTGTVESGQQSRPPELDRRRTRLFTGIVEDLGEVEAVEHLGDFARVHIRSAVVAQDAKPGDSICVSGVCLTVTGLIGSRPRPADGTQEPPSRAPLGFAADVMGETLRHSSLKSVAPGTKVNLERSVRLEDRLGGHLVQGHTDGTATIVSRDPQEQWEVVRISLPAGLARYIVHKGSVTVDGVSLTVSGIEEDWFEVSLIPETLKRTTLGLKQPGAEVNLEVDVIAKYVEKLLGGTR
jgi:riboflavin synthase